MKQTFKGYKPTTILSEDKLQEEEEERFALESGQTYKLVGKEESESFLLVV
jgi:hypothetical protein